MDSMDIWRRGFNWICM